jgi:hypothetical protein
MAKQITPDTFIKQSILKPVPRKNLFTTADKLSDDPR